MRKGAFMAGQANKRRDKDRIVLHKGESQRKDGNYDYRWTTGDGKRHSVYAKTLEELCSKEEEILRDRCNGIRTEARYVTINDVFEMWVQLKRGLKDNTFQNYRYMYEQFVKPDFGNTRLSQLKKSDVKRFYNTLADERTLKISTIDNIHTVLHQVLEMAAEDSYLRGNPSDNALKELKQSHNYDTEKCKALTVAEQALFLNFLRNNRQYNHWYPIFAVMLGTGLRVGEAAGLRWCNIDLEENIIDVNHTLVYYNHAKNGCYFNINKPKTKAGKRTVPMLEFVKQAFIQEKHYQAANEIRCNVKIDGYTDFIFLNRFGTVQHQGTINKALRRIIRDCNDEVLERNEANPVLLPRFSCHSLRHTFTTRMCEVGVNIKVMQDTLGHADITTTLNIYADVTKELKKKEFEGLEAAFKQGLA
jgi:integrase